jgi:lambda family phage portal protein
MPRRKRIAPQGKYDAAGSGRRIVKWSPPSSGPNRAIQGLQKIRDRARDVSRNDWAGESSLQKWTTNLVGVGIVPRWDDEAITERFNKWVPMADADGVLDFYGLETLTTRSWLDGGEVFGRRRPRLYVTKDAAPLQVQLIEAEFCPLFDADQWPRMPEGNTIRQGIERNKRGERVAYWMYREHPGDGSLGMAPGADQLLRVPASEIIHVFEPKRPGQLRGVSQLAPVLVRLRSTMDFEDAVLDRQKLANLFTLFITQQMPPDTADIEYDPLTGLPTFYGEDGKAMVGLEPGISQKLMPGEDVKFANPPEAGTTYSDYMRTTHMGTAAGSGLPYETFSGDIKDISDRTLRVVINEFRRFAKQRQWQILIPQFCQRVVEWWADADVLSGGLALSQRAAARAPKWSPHGWEYIHPTQDAEGKAKLIEIGVISRSEVIGERGDDPRTVDAERADDLKRSKALGLEPPEPPPPPPPPPKPAPTKAELELADLMMRRARAEVQALERPPVATETPMEHLIACMLAEQQVERQERQKDREQQAALTSALVAAVSREQPTPVVHNHVEPTPIHNHVEPTPINVEPTPVTVVNENTVNVTPDVNVNLPDRQITSVIERDDDGQIANVTQTETTLQ